MKSLIGLAAIALVTITTLVEAPRAGDADERKAGHVKMTGAVEARPAGDSRAGEWKVGGATVTVDGATRIQDKEQPLAVGTVVEVKGTRQPDGSVKAREIEVKRPRS